MKKILFVMFAFIALTFVACNSQVKSDIQSYKENVENVSVKEIDIDHNFYEYTNDYRISTDLLFGNIDRLVHAQVKSEYAASKGEKELYEKQYQKYQDFADSLQLRLDNIRMTSQQGTIYVAKYKGFNKFGKKDSFYSFGVFTYDKDGTIHEYDGNDKMELVLTAYPDAMKEAGKALKQVFGA